MSDMNKIKDIQQKAKFVNRMLFGEEIVEMYKMNDDSFWYAAFMKTGVQFLHDDLKDLLVKIKQYRSLATEGE